MTKGKDLENDYFMRENLANKHQAEQQRQMQQKKQYDQDLQALHFMKCPKCGHDLETKRMSYIDIDQCSSCGAIVLAHDDIDRFIAEEKSILKVLIDFFK